MSQCYDPAGALTKKATCAGYVTELKDSDYKLYSGNSGGVSLTSFVDLSSLSGGTVVENPSKKNVDSLGGFVLDDLKKALTAAGYTKPAPGTKPAPKKTTVDTYMILMIAFTILAAMGWTMFTLKATGVF